MKKSALYSFAALALLFGSFTAELHAAVVTYTWVTDSALGSIPTSASFEVDLAIAQTGTFGQGDIHDIMYSFPGIDPLSITTGSSIGFDNAAFVDTKTGLPVFHDNNQGLAAIAYHDMLFGNVFLSITFDNPVGTSVGDEFNAINGGPGSLGFGQGHWIVSGFTPATGGGGANTPEPATLTLFGLGVLGMSYGALRRRRTQPAAG
ncbi:MAG TPA: PEP-CTERM sorting domain-containing protein [Pirellulales bacterium]|nr:PEP-CTERM sorting domain-containing protein [Pirellulales bacterium]